MHAPDTQTRMTTFGYHKPSQQLRTALQDLKRVELDPDFDVEMDVWMAPSRRGVCEVCLAGAVVAKSLDLDFIDMRGVDYGGGPVPDWMVALDWARIGCWSAALTSWDIYSTQGPDLPVVPRYEDDREGFFDAMTRAADILAEAGH